MKRFLTLIFVAMAMQVKAQQKDSLLLKSPATTVYKPEILSSGFIDIVNNGQLNASARLIRLQIGEPGKFSVPLSLYSGVSNNNFQAQGTSSGSRNNEHLVSQYINPLSGLINLSAEDLFYFKKRSAKFTRTGFLYHTGARILTGYAPGTATRPVNFLNSFGAAGLYFQTGAWERGNSKNMGLLWLAARYIFCKSGTAQLRQLLPDVQTNGLYHGWSLAWGVEISNLVYIKLIYYRYIRKPEIAYTLPVYQFSFHYSMR